MTPGEPEAINGARVSDQFFSLLGATPVRGRGFMAEEQRLGGSNVAVITNGFWHSHFAGDEQI